MSERVFYVLQCIVWLYWDSNLGRDEMKDEDDSPLRHMLMDHHVNPHWPVV